MIAAGFHRLALAGLIALAPIAAAVAAPPSPRTLALAAGYKAAFLCSGLFDAGQTLQRALDPGRRTYVHLVHGSALVNGQRLCAGDALRLEREPELTVVEAAQAELLVLDLH